MPDPTESLSDTGFLSPSDIAGIEDKPVGEYGEEVSASEPEVATDEQPATDGPDLSFLDKEVLRDTLLAVRDQISDPETFFNELKRGYMREDDYTRKRQVESRKLKEAEALAEAGRLWNQLTSDPSMMDHILAFQKGGDPKTQEPELPSDWFELEPKQMLEIVMKQVEPKIRAAEESGYRKAVEEIRGPTTHIQSLEGAMVSWGEDNGVSEEILREVGQVMVNEMDLTRLTPDLIPVLLPRLVHSVTSEKALAAKKQQAESTSRKIDRARTASPRGGVGGASPDELPMEQKIKAEQERLGRKLYPEEVSDLAFREMLASMQKSEGELDRELKERGTL